MPVFSRMLVDFRSRTAVRPLMRILVPIALIVLLSACTGPASRRSALVNYYPMDNGCTGLTNKFLNAAATGCEQKTDEQGAMKSCVARQVGQACMGQNLERRSCAIQCLQDITHPDR